MVVRVTCLSVEWYFPGHWAFSTIGFSGMPLNSHFENFQVLKSVDTLAPIQPSSGLDWSLVNFCSRVDLICYLGTFLYDCSCGLTLEEPMQLLLAPEFVTFLEFLFHNLLSQNQTPKAHANSAHMSGRSIHHWAICPNE